MQQTNQQSPKVKKIKLDFKDSKYATGRRKTSIAKVWLEKDLSPEFGLRKVLDQYM